MKQPAFIVLADDLTGAAEVAAAGHARGLSAAVLTGNATESPSVDLLVHDTDSRLLAAAAAARKVTEVAERFAVARAVQDGAFLFKKTDSVLRGPVLAEIDALRAASGHKRALLVPANPALRRIVRGGCYFINDAPIDESIFRDDPHHPIRSAHVLDMLGASARADVRVLATDLPLPATGITVGEAASDDDLARWAGALDSPTLAAGSTAFFESVLHSRGFTRTERTKLAENASRVLIVSGTTAPTTRTRAGAFVMPEACASGDTGSYEIALARWTDDLAISLENHGHAIAVAPAKMSTDPNAPARIRTAFAALIARLHRHSAFDHVVIEGGSTAAEVVRTLGWNVLGVCGELAPGVATLTPPGHAKVRLTLKPGSYPWPHDWWQSLRPEQKNS